MAVPSAAAEVAIKKLARVGGNTVCPNCGVEKKFGFGTVCMKYLTFVCNECKSSHQAISHRCKSLTMSSWTDGEIVQIRTVGGNDRARVTWLAAAPPPGQNGRPAPGSSMDVYKAFIVDVYERKKYFRESAENGDDNAPASAPSPAPVVAQRQQPRLETKVPIPVPPPTPAPAPVADLLDFGAFDTVAPPAVSSAPPNLFDAFTAPAPTSSPAAQIFDPFGDNHSTAPAGSTPSTSLNTMDMFATASGPAFVNSVGSFDPFGAGGNNNGSTLPQSTTTTTKPPIMNNAAMSSSSNIGMMMGNMNSNTGSSTIGGTIMMNHPSGNKNINMMTANNSIMGNNGMMNHSGFGAPNGTTNMYGISNSNGMMMNGFPQSTMMMGANAAVNMGGANVNNNFMGTMNSSSGMQTNANNNIMMMMNGFQQQPNNYHQHVGSFPMMNSTMGGSNSTTAKSISTNFGTSHNSQQKQRDPFANLGL